MRKRERKVHLQGSQSLNYMPVCGTKSKSFTTTLELPNVTCKRCLSLAINKTPAGFGAKTELFDVVLTNNGPFRINVIREIRSLTNLGLKESKDLSDAACNEPQVILKAVDKDTAIKASRQLEEVEARVSVFVSGTNTPASEGPDAAMLNFHSSVYNILRQIIQDLPAKRDWLDPDLERRARALLGL